MIFKETKAEIIIQLIGRSVNRKKKISNYICELINHCSIIPSNKQTVCSLVDKR